MRDSAKADRPQDTERELIAFIRTKLMPGYEEGVVLGPDTPLFEDGLINSINILALIGFVEFGVGRRLDDSEILMPNFRSVRAIVSTFFA